MKKYIIILIVIISPLLSIACDICGCGGGNNYIGILPDFHKHIVGIRYRYNAMLSHVGVGGATSYLTTKERYNITEAWGGWNISDRVRVMAVVPYSFNEKINQGNKQSKDGIGDISLSGFYELLNNRNTISGKNDNPKLLVQSLWLGGGVKLATGKYNPSDKANAGQSTNLFQLGTGSYDFNLNAMYDIRLQDAGINLNSNYKINTANKFDYRYGNKLSLNSQAYYKFRTKSNIMIAPNAGIQYENSKTDMDENINVTVSGGRLLSGTIGLETGIGKFAIGANYQTPLSQNLANGIVKSEDRFMVHIAIAL
ncbi:transporter family protein [Niabella ginsengisoli]|uniref:Transporter n=1 Tax=Niabella ginsengisoli TaxID=522298 RepID=A0ABS9SIR1_9BACT|nr:transporter [Niabella ginsengisoli]MCH5598191.1 transporter [Niabella ginsengisoli]